MAPKAKNKAGAKAKAKAKATPEDITAIFRKFDTDGSGTIDRTQLTKVLQKIGLSEGDTDRLMGEIDTNGDGVIDYQEFTNWVMGGNEESRAVVALSGSSPAVERLKSLGLELKLRADTKLTALHHIETGVPVDRESINNFDDVVAAFQDYVHEDRFVKEYGLRWTQLPKEKGVDYGRFLMSSDFTESAKNGILFIITGTGAVRGGIWGRGLLLSDSVEHGSSVNLIKWARGASKSGKKLAVVIPDPNHPDLDPEINGGAYHCVEVWKHILLKSDSFGNFNVEAQAGPILAVAHSFGGACFIDCLFYTEKKSVLDKLKAIAFTDSVHFVSETQACVQSADNGMLDTAQLAVLREKAVHWRCGEVGTLDEVESEFNENFGCECRSAGIDEHTSCNFASELSVIRLFESKLQSAESEMKAEVPSKSPSGPSLGSDFKRDVCEACLLGDLPKLKALIESLPSSENAKEVLENSASVVRLNPELDRKKGEHAPYSTEDGTENPVEGAIFTPGFDTFCLRSAETAKAGNMGGVCKTSSPLQYAAYVGSSEIVKYLVSEIGVDKKSTGDFKWNAGSIASCSGKGEVAEVLKLLK